MLSKVEPDSQGESHSVVMERNVLYEMGASEGSMKLLEEYVAVARRK